jgi:hypothetical protein
VRHSFAHWTGVSSPDPTWNALIQFPGFGDNLIDNVVLALDTALLPFAVEAATLCPLTNPSPPSISPPRCTGWQNQ